MVELLPFCIDDRIFEMFCTSLRSLCDGRIGIGVTGAGVDVVATGGKGGGGPVGEVGIG